MLKAIKEKNQLAKESRQPNLLAEKALTKWRCPKCWFRGASYAATGSQKNWEKIKQMLENQDFRCIYSGRPLQIGENATLDHTIPSVRGGKKELSNVKWTDFEINQKIKYVFTPGEFLALSRVFWDRKKTGEQLDAIAEMYAAIWQYQVENNFPALKI